ncbi:hypothetical protein C8T65DRAFT_254546 [Cerioporus squamosus]|nr:hypothetical protein C8T65DRAFT_254546 [Cerioporus squamosus]
MVLKDGTYRIVTIDGKHDIGRKFVEDLSLLPKRVLTLPGPASGGRPSPTWEIRAVGDGKYKMKTGGSYVGILPGPDGKVCAFVLEDMLQGAEWDIKHVPQHSQNAYIILQKDGERGWSFKEDDYQQLSVSHVICTSTEPPQFMPNMVFRITPA